jgi:hypothetical protein
MVERILWVGQLAINADIGAIAARLDQPLRGLVMRMAQVVQLVSQ